MLDSKTSVIHSFLVVNLLETEQTTQQYPRILFIFISWVQYIYSKSIITKTKNKVLKL